MGTFTFRGCTQLGKVTLKSEDFESVGNNIFDLVASDCHFTVQNNKVKNKLMSQSGIAASQITVVSPEINPGNPGTPGIITPPAPTDTPESPTQPDKKETKDMDYLQFTSGRTLTIKAPEGIGDCSIT